MADVERPHSLSGSTSYRPTCQGAAQVLNKTLILYPLLLLIVFISSAAAYSIRISRKEEDFEVPNLRGPGGKPLPVSKARIHHDVDRSIGPKVGPNAQRVFKGLSLAVFFTFLANGGAHLAHFIEAIRGPSEDSWTETEPMTVFLIGSANLYLFLFVTLIEWKSMPSVVHFVTWTLGLAGEITICVCTFLQLRGYHNIKTYIPPASAIPDRTEKWEVVDFVIYAIRLGLLTALVGIYACLWAQSLRSKQEKTERGGSEADPEEATPLLDGSHASYNTQNGREATGRGVRARSNGNANGNTNGATEGTCIYKEESAAFYRPEKLPHKTWWEYLKGYSLFFPYLWPKDSVRLQLIVAICFTLLVAERAINILVPYQIGLVTNALEKHEAPWTAVGLLILFRLLQGPSMLLGAVRSMLWVPVSQYSYRALTTSAFEHVHSLSLDFHLGKRTGEVLSALNKGASINQFLEQVTFQVAPMLFDLILAVYFFYFLFDATFAVIVSCITFWYLFLTIRMAQTRADQRREMSNADREEEAVKNDSITSYETVKYFNAERWEFARYRNAINVFQEAEAKVTWGMNKMNIIQALVFMCGLMVILLLCAYQVMAENRRVGDFITLMTYLNQLQGPLNFFGTFYRQIQQAMISGERLLELFKIQPTVVDAPGVRPLEQCNGFIRWNNVAFSYDHRVRALRNLDFECSPGTTTAFVGESGGGKSTVFRLMFRYYNTTDGSIEIDGHDVKDLTIDSVRRYIGVVPQDTTMFNETLMYNLKYANPNATDKDVEDACRAASIHDRIMSFPDKYQTKVGDRGMRLSGGERQRVAIARTILKNPKIIMLDEATSALDAHTEQEIQDKLGNLGQGRTLLIIAHRLSTITHADQIIVLNNGTIVEKGTHEELVNAKGRYASMWEKQVQAERAAEKARVASKKAQKLMRKANISVAKKKTEGSSDGYNSLASSTILPGGAGGHALQSNRISRDSSPSSSSGSSPNESDVESSHTLHEGSPRH